MSTDDAGFSPLSYHCGSIWPHDTAIVLPGWPGPASPTPRCDLTDGLLGAAEAFDYRLPELYGGDDRAVVGRPVPYPAACRPQAWSAAASVLLLQAGVGLYPDVPAGRVTVRPLAGPALGALAVDRFRVAGAPVDVHVDSSGHATVTGLPAGLTLDTPTPRSTRPSPPRAPPPPPRLPTPPADHRPHPVDHEVVAATRRGGWQPLHDHGAGREGQAGGGSSATSSSSSMAPVGVKPREA